MEANGEFVLSIATARPGVLVNALRINPTTLGVSMSKDILQSYRRQTGRANNKHSDKNQCLSFTSERIEKSGTGLNTDGKDKKHQTEVPQSLGMITPKCPKSKAMKITADTSSDKPFILILPSIKPNATIRKSEK